MSQYSLREFIIMSKKSMLAKLKKSVYNHNLHYSDFCYLMNIIYKNENKLYDRYNEGYKQPPDYRIESQIQRELLIQIVKNKGDSRRYFLKYIRAGNKNTKSIKEIFESTGLKLTNYPEFANLLKKLVLQKYIINFD